MIFKSFGLLVSFEFWFCIVDSSWGGFGLSFLCSSEVVGCV